MTSTEQRHLGQSLAPWASGREAGAAAAGEGGKPSSGWGEKTLQCRPGEKKEADALCFQEVFLFLSLSLLMCLTDQMTAEIKVLVLHLISLW